MKKKIKGKIESKKFLILAITPYSGYPEYSDRSLREWQNRSSLRDWYEMKGEYSNEPFYIKERSRGIVRSFIKKRSHRAMRRARNVPKRGNGANKIYNFWWELL